MKRPRLQFLICEEWLRELRLTDTAEGWEAYLRYLVDLAGNEKEQKRHDFQGLASGWAIGTQGWRRALAKDHAHLSLSQLADARVNAEFKRLQWAERLADLLSKIGKTAEDVASDQKGAKWKIQIAEALRNSSTANIAWIAEQLNMGAPSSVRQYLSQLRRGNPPKALC
jgi:putative transposase